VSASLMWSMASEGCSEDERSMSFYYIFSAFYIAELVASFTASLAIDISPWIPCGLSAGSILLALLLLGVMPDPKQDIAAQTTPSMDAEQSLRELIYSSPTTSEATTTESQSDGFRSALSNTNVLLAIPVFLVGTLRYTTLNILIQYSYVRFNWKISTGALFYTETAIVNIVLFLFLIPQLTTHIRIRYNVCPEILDLTLVRISVFLMCIGVLCVGFSPLGRVLPFCIVIFAAGFGSRVSTLSLVSYWISDSSKASLYAAIAVLENIGHAVGDPSMQYIFAAVLDLPPFWLATPFFVASILYGLATISASFIRLDR